MNLAGQAIGPLLQQYPLSPTTAYFLLYDHLDREPGWVGVRLGGSHNGHNGVRSCHGVLGAKRDSIWQVRIGIGRPTSEVNCRSRNNAI